MPPSLPDPAHFRRAGYRKPSLPLDLWLLVLMNPRPYTIAVTSRVLSAHLFGACTHSAGCGATNTFDRDEGIAGLR